MDNPIFTPKPCPCGCKKWIMSPWFGCQCSSVSAEAKNELMDIARDAMRYREIRRWAVGLINPPRSASFEEQVYFDAAADILIVSRRVEDAPGS